MGIWKQALSIFLVLSWWRECKGFASFSRGWAKIIRPRDSRFRLSFAFGSWADSLSSNDEDSKPTEDKPLRKPLEIESDDEGSEQSGSDFFSQWNTGIPQGKQPPKSQKEMKVAATQWNGAAVPGAQTQPPEAKVYGSQASAGVASRGNAGVSSSAPGFTGIPTAGQGQVSGLEKNRVPGSTSGFGGIPTAGQAQVPKNGVPSPAPQENDGFAPGQYMKASVEEKWDPGDQWNGGNSLVGQSDDPFRTQQELIDFASQPVDQSQDPIPETMVPFAGPHLNDGVGQEYFPHSVVPSTSGQTQDDSPLGKFQVPFAGPGQVHVSANDIGPGQQSKVGSQWSGSNNAAQQTQEPAQYQGSPFGGPQANVGVQQTQQTSNDKYDPFSSPQLNGTQEAFWLASPVEEQVDTNVATTAPNNGASANGATASPHTVEGVNGVLEQSDRPRDFETNDDFETNNGQIAENTFLSSGGLNATVAAGQVTEKAVTETIEEAEAKMKEAEAKIAAAEATLASASKVEIEKTIKKAEERGAGETIAKDTEFTVSVAKDEKSEGASDRLCGDYSIGTVESKTDTLSEVREETASEVGGETIAVAGVDKGEELSSQEKINEMEKSILETLNSSREMEIDAKVDIDSLADLKKSSDLRKEEKDALEEIKDDILEVQEDGSAETPADDTVGLNGLENITNASKEDEVSFEKTTEHPNQNETTAVADVDSKNTSTDVTDTLAEDEDTVDEITENAEQNEVSTVSEFGATNASDDVTYASEETEEEFEQNETTVVAEIDTLVEERQASVVEIDCLDAELEETDLTEDEDENMETADEVTLPVKQENSIQTESDKEPEFSALSEIPGTAEALEDAGMEDEDGETLEPLKIDAVEEKDDSEEVVEEEEEEEEKTSDELPVFAVEQPVDDEEEEEETADELPIFAIEQPVDSVEDTQDEETLELDEETDDIVAEALDFFMTNVVEGPDVIKNPLRELPKEATMYGSGDDTDKLVADALDFFMNNVLEEPDAEEVTSSDEKLSDPVASAAETLHSSRAYVNSRENLKDAKARTQKRLSRTAYEKEKAADRIAKLKAETEAKTKAVEKELERKLQENQALIDKEVARIREVLQAEIDMEVEREARIIELISQINETIVAKQGDISYYDEIAVEMESLYAKLKPGAGNEKLYELLENKKQMGAIERELVGTLEQCLTEMNVVLEDSRSRAKRTREAEQRFVSPKANAEGLFEWTDIEEIEVLLEKAAENVVVMEARVLKLRSQLNALVDKSKGGEELLRQKPGKAKSPAGAPDDAKAKKRNDELELLGLLGSALGKGAAGAAKAALFGVKTFVDTVNEREKSGGASKRIGKSTPDSTEALKNGKVAKDSIENQAMQGATKMVKDDSPKEETAQKAGAVPKPSHDIFSAFNPAAFLNKRQNPGKKKNESSK